MWDTCRVSKVYVFLPLSEIREWMVGLWPLSPWPTAWPCWWARITALLSCPTASVLGSRKKLVNKSGVDQSSLYPKVRSILLSNTSNLYFVLTIPSPLFFYKKSMLKVENNRPDITEPIRAHSPSLSRFFQPFS